MISTPDDLHRFETTVRKPKGDGKIDAPNSRFASSPPLSLSLSLSLLGLPICFTRVSFSD